MKSPNQILPGESRRNIPIPIRNQEMLTIRNGYSIIGTKAGYMIGKQPSQYHFYNIEQLKLHNKNG